ncbi:hypothetical protein ACP4OV_030748 [Aristida adscensionis]
MIEQFVNFVIRPPRAEYNPDQYLWEPEFTLAGRKYRRLDLEQLTNERSQTLKCSHYVPAVIPEDTALPCVIYCHGNSGCRADANEAAVILLPSNITLFTLDFAGSGLSGGEYVSLGWHEFTSLLYGAEDPSIAGMVLDSAFSNLYDLMMELVEVYKIRVPKFTVKMAVQYMRRVIQRRAKFDIMDLNVVQFAPKTFIPALFGHASNDMFIQPHHTDRIHQAYAGDKNLIKFEGDHNSPRPQFYYDSVSIFFYNVLHPPQFPSTSSNKFDKYYNLGAFKGAAGTNESLLYEIINGLRAGTDAGSSSAATTKFTNATKSVVELLTERVNQLSVKNDNDLDFLLDENHNLTEMDQNTAECNLEDKPNRQNEECCSYTSSNRESWGRCSSLGAASDGSSPCERPGISNHKHKHDTKGTSDTTETDTKEASHDPKGEEESVPMEEAKERETRDGGKLIPALEAVSPRPGSTQENQIFLTIVNTHYNSE